MEFVLGVLAAAVAAGIAFAIVVLATGSDPGLVPRDRDRTPVTLPVDRPLTEPDVAETRFDTGLRGYRTSQVDTALARVAYDIGFKDELIRVLASEVTALRDGRTDDADTFRSIRQRAVHNRMRHVSAGTEDGAESRDEAQSDDEREAHAQDGSVVGDGAGSDDDADDGKKASDERDDVPAKESQPPETENE